MPGKLTLIPTPLDDQTPLEVTAFNLLRSAASDPENNIILVEDLKPARRRWLHFGLPRETIEHFIMFNEHNMESSIDQLIEKLKKGKNIFLMSDGGMPAFCDPGVGLVDQCHRKNIQVTSAPVPNSIIQAVALSGLKHDNFYFAGFVPKKDEHKISYYKKILSLKESVILMDTPYRLTKTLVELSEVFTQFGRKNREIFLALDLNMSSEQIFRADIDILKNKLDGIKGEFILMFGPTP